MKLYDVIRKEKMEKEGDVVQESPASTYTYSPRPGSRWKSILIVGIGALFLVMLYVVGMKVVHAKVVVTEKRIPFTLNGVELELTHEEEAGEGRLAYQTMLVPGEVSRQVFGSEVSSSTSNAHGSVVFFNEYSTKAQTIKKGTTLTSKEGKKYTTGAQVSVPGYTTKSGKKVPGTSTTVSITAAASGPSYNSSGTTFTVSGYSKTLYAQSSGAITGGDDGAAHSVAEKDRADVIANLQAQLVERLKRETRAQIPSQLITFPDLQVTNIDTSSTQLKGTTIKFPATMKGSMTTYLIDRDLLEAAIARQALYDKTYTDVSIPNLADIVVEPVSALPSDPESAPETIRVKVSGQGTIIAKAPLIHIKESLLGAKKSTFANLLSTIPEVDSAEYHFYPFWAPFFPSKESRITIESK